MRCFHCRTLTHCFIANTRPPRFRKACCMQDECVAVWRSKYGKKVKK
jgi:hypothetical protein